MKKSLFILLFVGSCAHNPGLPIHPLENSSTSATQPQSPAVAMSMIEQSSEGFWCAVIFCTRTRSQCNLMRQNIVEETTCVHHDHAWCFDYLRNGFQERCYSAKGECQFGRREYLKQWPDLKVNECELRR